jgi:IclR family acetate operon transcriptional repressor
VTDGPDAEPSPRPTGAQAVERALALLDCFADADELRLVELARRTGLQAPTAYRIAQALSRKGFLTQDPRTERYRLGVRMALLGRRAAGGLRLDDAQAALDELAAGTGESAALGVRAGGGELTVALVASSNQRLRFDHGAGDRVRLHASAMGKALLAFGGPDRAEALEDLGPLETFTAQTLTEPDALRSELTRIRRRGYALNHGERYDGVVGVAAPVLDDDGVARAAVGLQGPASRLSNRRLTALADEVRATAARLAGTLALDLL